MKQHGFEHAFAELVEAAALQTEITHHRLALEWGQMVFTHAVQLWNDIEAHETLAYEDKVAAQVHMLDEATSSPSSSTAHGEWAWRGSAWHGRCFAELSRAA